MSGTTNYAVEVEASEDGPDEAFATRVATCVARLLAQRSADDGAHPAPGDALEVLDTFDGPFVWEMSDAELEANPPSSVYVDVVGVDPVEPPAGGETVRVTVAVSF